MAENPRRFDTIDRVVRDLRQQLGDLRSTVMTRLATHTHPAQEVVQQTTGVGAVIRAYCIADTLVNNSTDVVQPDGMLVTLESNATYIMDGWLLWQSNTTADIKFSWDATGVTGLWSAFGPRINEEPVTGSPRINYIDTAGLSFGFSLALTGDVQVAGVYPSAAIKGYAVTGDLTDANSIGLRFAQNTANASDTIVKAGSWMRWTRVT